MPCSITAPATSSSTSPGTGTALSAGDQGLLGVPASIDLRPRHAVADGDVLDVGTDVRDRAGALGPGYERQILG